MQKNNREISIIKRNIIKYLDFKGISKYECYQKTGITNGVLSQQGGMSEENTLKFLSYYRDINIEWLLTCKGEMIKTNTSITQNQPLMMPKVIVVSEQDKELIPLVPVKAAAGYLSKYDDPVYIKNLPAYSIPGMRHGTYRMFEVEGLSMHPTLHPSDIVICRYVDNINEIRDERVYVVNHKEGVVVKRVINRYEQEGKLFLKSDNYKDRVEYPTITVFPEDIREIWYVVAYISHQLIAPDDLYKRVTDLEVQFTLIRDQLNPQPISFKSIK